MEEVYAEFDQAEQDFKAGLGVWQKWQKLFAYGKRLAAENNLKEEDVMIEIKLHRSGIMNTLI
jgi:uncharacterized protein YfbU (UPF0304 family)